MFIAFGLEIAVSDFCILAIYVMSIFHFLNVYSFVSFRRLNELFMVFSLVQWTLRSVTGLSLHCCIDICLISSSMEDIDKMN